MRINYNMRVITMAWAAGGVDVEIKKGNETYANYAARKSWGTIVTCCILFVRGFVPAGCRIHRRAVRKWQGKGYRWVAGVVRVTELQNLGAGVVGRRTMLLAPPPRQTPPDGINSGTSVAHDNRPLAWPPPPITGWVVGGGWIVFYHLGFLCARTYIISRDIYIML